MTSVLANPFASSRMTALGVAGGSVPTPVQVTITDRRGTWTALVTEPTVVGRQAEGISLDDPSISRRHVLLRPGASSFTVADLGSTNGTRLNHVPLHLESVANPGDVLRLGDSTIVVDGPVAEAVPTGLVVPPVVSPAAPPIPAGPVFEVELTEGSGAVRRLTVDRQISFGRWETDVVLDDPSVSRQHLWLSVRHAELVATDLGSSFGTRANGYPVNGEVSLRPGDVLELGSSRVLVVSRHDPGEAPVVAAPAPVADPGVVPPGPPPASPPGGDRATSGAGEPAIDTKADRKRIPVKAEPLPPFPNYTQLPRRLPIAAWHPIRIVSVIVFLTLCVALFLRPDGGLFFFFRILVPILPALLLVAPGVWRNICPLAASNQTPRLLNFTRGKTAPKWMKDRGGGYLIGVGLFLAIVSSRKVLFNTNGPALALLLLAVIIGAFIGGVVFKGKSGWCSSHCPMLPVERLYGQTPFVTVPNSHCQPCVGCTKHCYDFNPGVAYQADMADPDGDWSAPRKFFAGALPGIIVGFFAFPSPPAVSVLECYGTFFAATLVSVGIFFLLDAYTRSRAASLAALFGATAFSLFYWYNAQPFTDALAQVFGVTLPLVWVIRAASIGLAFVWFVRTSGVRLKFKETNSASSVKLAPGAASALAASGGEPEVRFLPSDNRVVAKAGQSVLEVAESASVPIEVGCRLGVCGADPIAVMEGMENLDPVTDEEADTLRRLGFASNTRMACCARINGPVCVSVTPEKAGTYNTGVFTAPADPNLRKVVVIGNGIAGVTTADFVRRGHPDCEIHVVGREQHPLYNRMGIARLVYGRSAMQGLYLLDDAWYTDHDVTLWLNTHVSQISLAEQRVDLATGEQLDYDKLVLAMGSSSTVLDVPGWGLPGSFVMREAADAIELRDYLQRNGVRHAVVAGAGLLGLEAAHALREFGVGVTVLDRGTQLMVRQSDQRCSQLLEEYFTGLGITVTPGTVATELRGEGRIEGVMLSDGSWVPAGAFVVCAGITPNIELAQAAGVACNRGILVDERMATNVPGVFAVGDVAEFGGAVPGLWPTAVSHAEVAAANVLGRDETYEPAFPAVILKGVGLDLVSVGRFTEEAGDEVIILDGPGIRYLKFVVQGGYLVGAIALGRSDDSPKVMAAVKKQVPLDANAIARLRAGDLAALDAPQPAPA